MLLQGRVSHLGALPMKRKFSERSELIETEVTTELGMREDARQEPVLD
jgi:hypothetical protein